MKVLYDKNDLPYANTLPDGRFEWLIGLGATELSELGVDEAGFLFGYDHGDEHYRKLVAKRPNLLDRPDDRQELLRLDVVLQRLDERGIQIRTPKTWVIEIDDRPPPDLEFPVFVRTAKSSWKRGGTQSRANNLRQLNDEMELLRRRFGWDTPILVRKWIDVAVAGKWMFGDAPQEIRVWIVDQAPVAWSFHYLQVVQSPLGFPPARDDLLLLAGLAADIATAFKSRLIVADFIRDRRGNWYFLEAGPGAVAGTAHEPVFKYVVERVRGNPSSLIPDVVGGLL